MTQHFGRFLRESRLKVEFGLRNFAVMIDMKPSNLSNMEHGRISPPKDARKLTKIAKLLGIEENSAEWRELFDLAAQKSGDLPMDVLDYAAATKGIPVLLRSIKESKMTKEELLELTEYLRSHYRKEEDN